MSRNIDGPERLLRGVVGLVVLGLYGALPAPWHYLSLIGLVLLASGISGNSLLYSLIGRPPLFSRRHTGRGEV